MPLEFSDGLGQISDWSGSGASDAAISDPITPDSIASTSSISGAPTVSLSIDLDGMSIPSGSSVGSGLAVDPLPAEALVSVYINGVDVTHLVESEGGGNSGIQRNMQTGGGSKATCQFTMNNRNGTLTEPASLSEVLIYTRDTEGNLVKFFGGKVASTSRFNFTGAANLTRLTVNCMDWGCLLDYVVVGREIQAQIGNDPTIITYQLSSRFFEPRVGVKYRFTGFPPRGGLGDMIFNWVSGTDAMNRVAQDSGGNWRVDFDKTLYLYGNDGYMAAPFTVETDNGKWRNLKVDRDTSRRRNRIYLKTTQNNAPLWTDRFTVVGGEFLWITMAPLGEKPIVRVSHDGGSTFTPAVVVNYEDIGSVSYDFYWINTTVISNPSTLPSAGTVIDVTYLSPLSYVAIAEDAEDIAANGPLEGVETVPDVPTKDAQQAYAEAILERRKIQPTTISFETDEYGLEAGMALTVNVPRSEVNDTFLITGVQTSEQAKRFFRHQVTAVDVPSQIGDEATFFKALQAKNEQARDRLTQHLRFLLAETIPGFDNPGLSTVTQYAILTAPVDGIAQSVSIYANSADTPTSVDSKIDILQNGVSIFPSGDDNKLIWPAGVTARQVKLDFRADPMEIRRGDLFHPVVIEGDPLAHDLIVDIAMLVR